MSEEDILREEVNRLEGLAKSVSRLYGNDDFKKVILREFVDNGIHRFVINDNVDSDKVRDELKARRILVDFLYGIISTAEKLKSEQKDNQ